MSFEINPNNQTKVAMTPNHKTQSEYRAEQHEIAERVAAEHGCEIVPTAGDFPALRVQARYQRGFPLDDQCVAACFAELKAAGVNTHGWVS